MGFPSEIKEQALIACKRHCVLCEKYKGIGIECHHIKPKAKGGDDIFENCIPVCFDCHQEIGSYNSLHPKGNKYTIEELKVRRDSFYIRVQNGEFPKTEFAQARNESDITLYMKIKQIFNEPNLMYYLVKYDLGNDFDNKVFYPLNELHYMENNPDFEFVDYELEEYRKELFRTIYNFLGYKATNTFPTHLNTQAIGTWNNDNYDYKEKMKINSEFNDLATEVWNSYKKLINQCKRKLS